MREIVIDGFAGGGGASEGITAALGFGPDIAINHDAWAIAMHRVNHPDTFHLITNVWKVDPYAVAQGRPVGLAWFSPDCKDFSKAKGGKPVRKHIRDLAWVVVAWARTVQPRVIMLENVEEFQDWGPLLADGTRCPNRKGLTFKKFIRELRRLGYKVEWRELVAAEYGSPTTRKRLFIIARRDGLPIVWPKPTHAAPASIYGLKDGKVYRGEVEDIRLRGGGERRTLPFRTAASCIDWTLPCYSIFITNAESKAMWKRDRIKIIRPLAKNTMARIARGVKRYVIDAEKPFIVPVTHPRDERVHSIDEPIRTVTGAQRGEHALVAPVLTYAQQGGANRDPRDPMHTVTASRKDQNAVVAPVMVGVGSRAGQSPERSVDRPAPTITATKRGQHAIAAAHLMTMRNADKPYAGADEPTHTVTAGGAGLTVVEAGLINTRNGEREGQEPRVRDLGEPAPTTTAKGSQGGVAVAFLAQHNTDMVGHDATEPVSTIVQKGCTQGMVAAHTISLKGSDRRDGPADAPAPAQCAGGTSTGVVEAFLGRYFGTEQDPRLEEAAACQTTKDRTSLVQVYKDGPWLTEEQYERAKLVTRFLRKFGCWDGGEVVTTRDGSVIVDIGMRMLVPRELFRAQGFRDTYIIDHGITEKGERIALTKTVQIRLVGNSVCPQVAEALVRANYVPLDIVAGMPEPFELVAAAAE